MRTFSQEPKANQQTTSAKSTTPSRAHFGQSPEVNSILHLQRTIGNQAVQRMLQTSSEELKAGSTGTASPPGQKHERRKRLQPSNLGQIAVPPIVHEVLASPGQPLDAETRAFMEPRFGHDFSPVRIHADTKAAESAELVNGLAYTVGWHVVLGEGQPSPETGAGRQLLAHELAHVVQQSRSGLAPELTPFAPHEQDADAAATAVAMGLPSVRVACHTGVGLARTNGDAAAAARAAAQAAAIAELDELLRDSALRDVIAGQLGPMSGLPHAVRLPVGKLEELLQRAINTGAPDAEAARRYLERLRDVRSRLRDLSPLGTRTEFKGIGGKAAQTGAKVEQAVSAGAKVKQGVQTGAKRLATVAVKGGAMVKGAATTALGALSIVDPLLLPGPLNAISLMVDVAKGYTAAWDIIKRENTQSGFAAGLASSLLRLSPDEVRHKLERRSAASGVTERFAGAVGMAESSFNRALGEGYRFGNHLPREGRNALRELSGLLARDKSSDTIWAVAKALLPTVDQIFEEARKKEKAARQAEQARRTRERFESGETTVSGLEK